MSCNCGYEEGHSEADLRYHEEYCRTGSVPGPLVMRIKVTNDDGSSIGEGDRQYDFSELTAKLKKNKFFEERAQAASYEDGFDPFEWQKQSRDLGITEQDEVEWATAVRKEREKASLNANPETPSTQSPTDEERRSI
jgi:hypothetical protein